jgi:purine-cytosine permease-like protein
VAGFLFDREHRPLAGWVSMLVAMVVSVWLFANQTLYTGLVAKAAPGIGDIAFFVGFVVAAVLYLAIHTVESKREPREAILVTPEGTTAAT